MRIENTEIFGFRAALRSMRNPKDSWSKNDLVAKLYQSGADISGVH
jgi:hypothetical protein